MIITIFTLGMIRYFFTLSSKDFSHYASWLHKKNALALHNHQTHNASQQRKNVQKDIYLAKEKERQHLRIFSDASDLLIKENKGSIKYSEKFYNVQCWIQEQVCLSPPSQQLRYFTADSGKYSFHSHHFSAQNTHIIFLTLPSIAIPSSVSSFEAFLVGNAESIDYYFLENTPHFHAQKCVFEFNPKKMP
ncbi:MAG: hypothetical protein JW769_01040 [Parachlamydiales bacterium]|nr:hypothetical protein [Parachlamydiales bacterium]